VHGIAGIRHKFQQQFLRLFAVIGAGGLDERDGLGQRRSIAAANGFG
jgi:hypothetical protein